VLGSVEHCFSEGPIETKVAKILLFQLLQALEHFHTHSVVHRDLKPANVLVESVYPLHFRLADFDLAKEQLTMEILYNSSVCSIRDCYS
jgi:serine/threonine protein kinase